MTSIRSLVFAGLAGLALTACGKPAEEAKAPGAPNPALAGLPPPYNTADVDHGKQLFAQCRSCHSIAEGGADMTGPNLHGMFGRKAGGKEGYKYSPAMAAAGFTWDAAHLDGWLAAPRTYLPGTKMTFLGMAEEKDRVDLIAYLKTETGFKP